MHHLFGSHNAKLSEVLAKKSTALQAVNLHRIGIYFHFPFFLHNIYKAVNAAI